MASKTFLLLALAFAAVLLITSEVDAEEVLLGVEERVVEVSISICLPTNVPLVKLAAVETGTDGAHVAGNLQRQLHTNKPKITTDLEFAAYACLSDHMCSII
ncbi:hypothetical protein Tco_0502475 [Tanacetum coccineum]